jgi:hypothetical protein
MSMKLTITNARTIESAGCKGRSGSFLPPFNPLIRRPNRLRSGTGIEPPRLLYPSLLVAERP